MILAGGAGAWFAAAGFTRRIRPRTALIGAGLALLAAFAANALLFLGGVR